MVDSDTQTLQAYILEWFFNHQNTILTKSMLPKLEAFKSLEKDHFFAVIEILEHKGLLISTKLSQGAYASEVIKVSPSANFHMREKMHACIA